MDFSEFETAGGGIWRICAVIDYVTKYCLAVTVTPTARGVDALACGVGREADHLHVAQRSDPRHRRRDPAIEGQFVGVLERDQRLNIEDHRSCRTLGHLLQHSVQVGNPPVAPRRRPTSPRRQTNLNQDQTAPTS
jgi:hypothetical protein